MTHRWPPNDAADGNGYGPDPKAPIRGLAQITMTRRGAPISSSYHRPGADGSTPTSSKNPGAAACVQAPLGHSR